MKHKHAELIIAWANGAEIEYFSPNTREFTPIWLGWGWDTPLVKEYRIKPTPRPQWQQNLIDAARSGKVVEYGGMGFAYFKSDLNELLDNYDFKGSTPEHFRIRPAKVTRYLWAHKGAVLNHFASEKEVRLNGFQDGYKRLDWSATEFEE